MSRTEMVRNTRPIFFTSRRRHTRWPRDWSSDVCSSDLLDLSNDEALLNEDLFAPGLRKMGAFAGAAALATPHPLLLHKIGRASCRERVWRWGGAAAMKMTTGLARGGRCR